MFNYLNYSNVTIQAYVSNKYPQTKVSYFLDSERKRVWCFWNIFKYFNLIIFCLLTKLHMEYLCSRSCFLILWEACWNDIYCLSAWNCIYRFSLGMSRECFFTSKSYSDIYEKNIFKTSCITNLFAAFVFSKNFWVFKGKKI